jgi:hypothetical protein
LKFSLDSKLVKQSFDVDAWVDRKAQSDALKALGYENYWKPHDAKGQPQG